MPWLLGSARRCTEHKWCCQCRWPQFLRGKAGRAPSSCRTRSIRVGTQYNSAPWGEAAPCRARRQCSWRPEPSSRSPASTPCRQWSPTCPRRNRAHKSRSWCCGWMAGTSPTHTKCSWPWHWHWRSVQLGTLRTTKLPCLVSESPRRNQRTRCCNRLRPTVSLQAPQPRHNELPIGYGSFANVSVTFQLSTVKSRAPF